MLLGFFGEPGKDGLSIYCYIMEDELYDYNNIQLRVDFWVWL